NAPSTKPRPDERADGSALEGQYLVELVEFLAQVMDERGAPGGVRHGTDAVLVLGQLRDVLVGGTHGFQRAREQFGGGLGVICLGHGIAAYRLLEGTARKPPAANRRTPLLSGGSRSAAREPGRGRR